MKRVLFLLAFCAAAAVLTACGDDNPDNDNENGPASDVAGVWLGNYTSAQTDRAGEFCVEIMQDQRELSGTLVFAGEAPLEIGGRIANERLSFVWAEQGQASPDVVHFTTGGTFSGDADGDSISGTWTSVDGDRGDWSATRPEAAPCSD